VWRDICLVETNQCDYGPKPGEDYTAYDLRKPDAGLEPYVRKNAWWHGLDPIKGPPVDHLLQFVTEKSETQRTSYDNVTSHWLKVKIQRIENGRVYAHRYGTADPEAPSADEVDFDLADEWCVWIETEPSEGRYLPPNTEQRVPSTMPPSQDDAPRYLTLLQHTPLAVDKLVRFILPYARSEAWQSTDILRFMFWSPRDKNWTKFLKIVYFSEVNVKTRSPAQVTLLDGDQVYVLTLHFATYGDAWFAGVCPEMPVQYMGSGKTPTCPQEDRSMWLQLFSWSQQLALPGPLLIPPANIEKCVAVPKQDAVSYLVDMLRSMSTPSASLLQTHSKF